MSTEKNTYKLSRRQSIWLSRVLGFLRSSIQDSITGGNARQLKAYEQYTENQFGDTRLDTELFKV